MPYHKWLILRGEGLNGKGTLLTLIRVFLGIENVDSGKPYKTFRKYLVYCTIIR